MRMNGKRYVTRPQNNYFVLAMIFNRDFDFPIENEEKSIN